MVEMICKYCGAGLEQDKCPVCDVPCPDCGRVPPDGDMCCERNRLERVEAHPVAVPYMSPEDDRKLLRKMSGELPNPIEMFMHCADCVREAKEAGVTPREYMRLEAGVSFEGTHLTVWCIRHEQHIVTLPLADPIHPECAHCAEDDDGPE